MLDFGFDGNAAEYDGGGVEGRDPAVLTESGVLLAIVGISAVLSVFEGRESVLVLVFVSTNDLIRNGTLGKTNTEGYKLVAESTDGGIFSETRIVNVRTKIISGTVEFLGTRMELGVAAAVALVVHTVDNVLWLSEEETKSKNEQEDDPEEEEDATANRICASLSSTKNNFKIVFVVFRGTTTHVSRIVLLKA